MSGSELPTTCSNCGDSLPLSDWHPIEVTTGEDDGMEIHGFCDEDCLEAWR